MSQQDRTSITTPMAAKALCVSRPTIVRMIADGTLAGEKIGRDWWVTLESVDAEFARRYPDYVRREATATEGG